MSLTQLLVSGSEAWRELETDSRVVQIRYTSDLTGGTYYIVQFRKGASFARTWNATRKHLPPAAELMDGDSSGGRVYLTYHLKGKANV